MESVLQLGYYRISLYHYYLLSHYLLRCKRSLILDWVYYTFGGELALEYTIYLTLPLLPTKK